MPDVLISLPSAAARSSAVMTRWRRRRESAFRPSSIGWARVVDDVLWLVWCRWVLVFMRWPLGWSY
jgi:hypothetical protein